MKIIPCTRGLETMVDDEDYPSLTEYRWCVAGTGKREIYVRRAYRMDGRLICVLMHRQIMGNPPSNVHVDHIDHNPLNNQKHNLRLCTNAQNRWNSQTLPGKSGYIGVWKNHNKWSAFIGSRENRVYLGQFDSAREAAVARDVAALRIRGEFAVLNFPTQKG